MHSDQTSGKKNWKDVHCGSCVQFQWDDEMYPTRRAGLRSRLLNLNSLIPKHCTAGFNKILFWSLTTSTLLTVFCCSNFEANRTESELSVTWKDSLLIWRLYGACLCFYLKSGLALTSYQELNLNRCWILYPSIILNSLMIKLLQTSTYSLSQREEFCCALQRGALRSFHS